MTTGEKIFVGFVGLAVVGLFVGLLFGFKAYSRYQARQDANNVVSINEIKIKQQEQLIQVEKQKAEIRIVEAQGIAESQKIINATLTDKYLQHEAIQAQEKMANSPNHTTIYIPSGQNGIPLVKTIE
jgi:hypothetical protein